VRVDLMESCGNFDVVEVSEAVLNPPGQIPLEEMDFTLDPKRQRLIPNPEHGERKLNMTLHIASPNS